MKPQVARKLAVRHLCVPQLFLATGGFKFQLFPNACMVYKQHSTFMLCVVKMVLKGGVGGCALNSHENYIVDHGKSWKNHGIVILNFCGNPNLIACTLIRLTRIILSQ